MPARHVTRLRGETKMHQYWFFQPYNKHGHHDARVPIQAAKVIMGPWDTPNAAQGSTYWSASERFAKDRRRCRITSRDLQSQSASVQPRSAAWRTSQRRHRRLNRRVSLRGRRVTVAWALAMIGYLWLGRCSALTPRRHAPNRRRAPAQAEVELSHPRLCHLL